MISTYLGNGRDLVTPKRSNQKGWETLTVWCPLYVQTKTVEQQNIMHALQGLFTQTLSALSITWKRSICSIIKIIIISYLNCIILWEQQFLCGCPLACVLGDEMGPLLDPSGVMLLHQDTEETEQLVKLQTYPKDTKPWMSSNVLLLNSWKTEVVMFGPETLRARLDTWSLSMVSP